MFCENKFISGKSNIYSPNALERVILLVLNNVNS